MVFYNKFISNDGVENLANYKYTSTGYTTLDNFLNTYWYKWVEYLPDTFAPNLITLVGALFVILPTWAFVFYDPSFTEKYPPVLFLIAGIGVWVYQTLDALDGKQARRIGQASPLGQLLDHGCDSFGGVYLMLLLMCCAGFGDPFLAYGCVFLYILSFYFANWSEYYTHISMTNVGDFGVTEVQWLTIILLLSTAWTGEGLGTLEVGSVISIFPTDGPDGWMKSIGSLTFGQGVFYIILASAPFNVAYTWNITKDKLKDKSAAIKKLFPLVQILAVFMNFATIESLWPYKGYVMVGIGMYNSLLICKFIVNGLAGDDFSCLQWELIIPGQLGVGARMSEDGYTQFLCVFLLNLSGFLLFCDFTRSVVGKISEVLEITNVFTVPGGVLKKYRAKIEAEKKNA